MTADAPIAGPHTVYTGRTTNWPMVAATSAGAVLLIVFGASGESGSGDRAVVTITFALVAIGVLANVLTSSSVRASAGPNGLDIRWGVVGWPRCTYALDEIASAEVTRVPAWRVTYGLWWTPKRTTCTIRPGDAVRLTLANGRLITVTVPDPELAVQAIIDAQPTLTS